MIVIEPNTAAIVRQRKALEAAILSANPKAEKAAREIIRRAIWVARNEVRDAVGKKPSLESDPRQAARAVRNIVYRKTLGANINIYNAKKAHPPKWWEPAPLPRKSNRGGNRMQRSDRTIQMMSYGAVDRGFILRWVNEGTRARYAGYGRNGNTDTARDAFTLRIGGRGFRDRITPRNFFKPLGEKALVKAADTIANLIDDELVKIMQDMK